MIHSGRVALMEKARVSGFGDGKQKPGLERVQ
jgi:hypothetical protein